SVCVLTTIQTGSGFTTLLSQSTQLAMDSATFTGHIEHTNILVTSFPLRRRLLSSWRAAE
ncbi:hypothetical protein SCB29_41265, partial [Paraburkholderia sp. SIMBA_055]